jgi:signal transduction histidine kinase
VCWFDERAYPAGSSTPALARRFTRDSLHEVLGAGSAVKDIVEDTGLIVSELVTNAVNAGATTVAVRLGIHHDHLRIDVDDDALGLPTLRTPSPRATGGRGLRIIEQLVRGWGSRPSPLGKQVWAELAYVPATTFRLNCTI